MDERLPKDVDPGTLLIVAEQVRRRADLAGYDALRASLGDPSNESERAAVVRALEQLAKDLEATAALVSQRQARWRNAG